MRKHILALCIIALFAAPLAANQPTTLSVWDDVPFQNGFGIEVQDGSGTTRVVPLQMKEFAQVGSAKVGIVEARGVRFKVREYRGLRAFEELQPFQCDFEDAVVAEIPLGETSPNLSPMSGGGPKSIKIRKLMVYPPSSIALLGSEEMVLAEIQLAEDHDNLVLRNTELSWVRKKYIGVRGPEIPNPRISDVYGNQEIRDLRDFYGAQLVSYLPPVAQPAGTSMGYHAGDPEYAYSIVAITAMYEGSVHEDGHGAGLDHDLATAGSGMLGVPNYNHAVIVCTGSDPAYNFRTVMAQGAPCPMENYSVPTFSGEGLSWGGVPIWDEYSKAKQVLEETLPIIAGYRQRLDLDPCIPSADILCIDSTEGNGDRRFEVQVVYTTYQPGFRQSGTAGVMGTFGNGGDLFFFSPGNKELIIKVVNGCSNNGNFWVFLAPLTNVGYTVVVRDSLTGIVWEYTHFDASPAGVRQDNEALPCE